MPVANPDVDKHSSSGNNVLRDLQPKDYDCQQQIHEDSKHETASATHLQTEALTLSSESVEEVHSGNQQNEFHSPDLSDYLERNGHEELSFKDADQTNAANLPTREEHEPNIEQEVLIHHNNEADAGNTPVAVSESGNDDDNHDSNPNQIPDGNANSTILLCTTAGMHIM